LTIAKPIVVFDNDHYVTAFGMFDASADGKRLVMIKEADDATAVTDINVAINWDAELTRLLPAK
jgi:hypothetical protein